MSITQTQKSKVRYVDLLSTIQETNRPPGGKASVARLARRLNIGPNTRVLEIGSNTGFTSIELVKLTGCTARGIDVNEAAVAESERWRQNLTGGLDKRIEFVVGDAAKVPFDDDSFDVVVCGGANTFVQRRAEALAEYRRVLRPYGLVSITNLFYRSSPPAELLDDLEAVLGFRVPAHGIPEWLDVFVTPGWEMLDLESSALSARAPEVVDAYVDWLCADERLLVDANDREQTRDAWRDVMHVFNRNHQHLGFMELTLRSEDDGIREQPELFLQPGRYDPFFTQSVVPQLNP